MGAGVGTPLEIPDAGPLPAGAPLPTAAEPVDPPPGALTVPWAETERIKLTQSKIQHSKTVWDWPAERRRLSDKAIKFKTFRFLRIK